MKGQESYELLQNSCSSVFKSANKLVERKNFTVGGRDIAIEVYLGGDYKVIYLIKAENIHVTCFSFVLHHLLVMMIKVCTGIYYIILFPSQSLPFQFLLLVMGMKSATSDYACIWCKVHKKDR